MLGLSKLYQFWLFLLRKGLFLFVRTRQLPQDLKQLELSSELPVFYAFAERSTANMLVANQVVLDNQLPSVMERVDVGGYKAPRAHFNLRKRGGVLGNQIIHQTDKQLEALCQYLKEHPEQEVQIVPVSIMWGRSPDKEESIFKIVFSDNWSMPGFLRKVFMVLIHGRQTYVQFSRPMSLRQLVSDSETSEIAVRKVGRVLRVHFRRQQEAMIGPDLSHRRTLMTNLMARERVQEQIRETAKEKNIPIQRAEAEAMKYGREIAAHYSHVVIRVLEVLLAWLWNRLYRGVRLNYLDDVVELAKDHEIVYVPSHRSHIDYLLLSYVLFSNGLVPPHIAAGVNLNMPVVGPILRRGGAFFMRRSFKGNPLYATVFAEYFYMMMDKGFSIEYFVEGGRSRTGRMLSPRAGMLAMTVRGYLQGKRKPVAFVPVYFGYEKIIESGSYVSELHGKKKKKESLGGLIASWKRLKESFGEVHVNFAEPIIMESFLDETAPGWQQQSLEDGDKAEWFTATVDQLATEVVTRINSAAAVNPVNLLAISLLSTRRHAMEEETLDSSLEFSIRLLQKLKTNEHVTISETDSRKLINYGLELGIMERREHPLGDVIVCDDANAVTLTYFRNNVIHLFALPSLIASLVLNSRSFRREELVDLAVSVYPFIQAELLLHWGEEEARERLQAIIDFLLDEGLLAIVQENGEEQIAAADMQSSEYKLLAVLGRTTRQSLQRYYIVVRILANMGSGKISATALEKQAVLVAQRLAMLFEFNSPEFSDEKLFRVFIQKLVRRGFLTAGDDRNLVFDKRLSALDDQSRLVLPFDVRRSVIQSVAQIT